MPIQDIGNLGRIRTGGYPFNNQVVWTVEVEVIPEMMRVQMSFGDPLGRIMGFVPEEGIFLAGPGINYTYDSTGRKTIAVVAQPDFEGVDAISYLRGGFVFETADHTPFVDVEEIVVGIPAGNPDPVTEIGGLFYNLNKLTEVTIDRAGYTTSTKIHIVKDVPDTVTHFYNKNVGTNGSSYADLPLQAQYMQIDHFGDWDSPPAASELPMNPIDVVHYNGILRDIPYWFQKANNTVEVQIYKGNWSGNSAGGSVAVKSDLTGPVWEGSEVAYSIGSVRAHLISQPNTRIYDTRDGGGGPGVYGDLKTPIGGTGYVDPNDPASAIDYSNEPSIFGRTQGEPIINSNLEVLALYNTRMGWPPVDFSQATSLHTFRCEIVGTPGGNKNARHLWATGVFDECVNGLWVSRNVLNSNGDGSCSIDIREKSGITSLSQEAKYQIAGLGPDYADGLYDAGHSVEHSSFEPPTSNYTIQDATTIELPWADSSDFAVGSVFRILGGPNAGQYEIESVDEANSIATIVSDTANLIDDTWPSIQTAFADPSDSMDEVMGVGNRVPYTRDYDNTSWAHRYPTYYLDRGRSIL